MTHGTEFPRFEWVKIFVGEADIHVIGSGKGRACLMVSQVVSVSMQVGIGQSFTASTTFIVPCT
jgi:hypothetical protein